MLYTCADFWLTVEFVLQSYEVTELFSRCKEGKELCCELYVMDDGV
jgi:hypothetical protein